MRLRLHLHKVILLSEDTVQRHYITDTLDLFNRLKHRLMFYQILRLMSPVAFRREFCTVGNGPETFVLQMQ